MYVDLACAHCAAVWAAVRELPLRLCVRHFPMAAKHRRAPMLHAAAEAAAMQREEGFWQLVDAIYADPSRQDDPHLWVRAEAIGLDLDRFDADRRSEAVAARVRRDFQSGVRAGVTGTPAAFVGGRLVSRPAGEGLARLATTR